MPPKNLASQSPRHPLTQTGKKRRFLEGIEEVENKIAKALAGGRTLFEGLVP